VQESKPKQVKRQSEFAIIWRRFKRNKIAMAGMIIVVAYYFIAILAPILAPYDPQEIDLLNPLSPPGKDHLLGTDPIGRDVLSRIIYGARISLLVGTLAVLLGVTIGILAGLVAGYYGGNIDDVIMRINDVMWSFPVTLLAIVVAGIVGPNVSYLIFIIGIIMVPRYTRVIRGTVLSIKERDYILAARALGCGNLRILFRQILPNAIGPIIVVATMSMAGAILTESGLSFLGFGIAPPTPTWGNMIASGRQYIRTCPHLIIYPGIAITLTVLGFNLFGDGLRDAIDPRLKI